MAKTKAELLDDAAKLKLEVTEKNTVAEINQAIKDAKEAEKAEAKEVIASREAEVAKAGKRSQKALDEAEAKAEKEARKAAGDTEAQGDAEATKAKGPAPKIRPKIERRGKKYREVAKLIDKEKVYSLSEAVELAAKTNPSKIDASLEVHVGLGVDPRQADQNVRSTIVLPHGTGKKVRIAVFAHDEQLAEAKETGADIAMADDFLASLDKGQIDFDVLITLPDLMPKLGRYARVLGPKGLMPNPKSGTVTTNLELAIKNAKAGQVEYRVDKQAIIHLSVGKISFGQAKLEENLTAFVDDLKAQKPSSLKGAFIKQAFLTTTHGPSIKVSLD